MTARPLSDDLYVLKFLTEKVFDDDAQACEYRLLCSGILSAGNPRSVSARTLLEFPVEWVVASEIDNRIPIDEWPLETVMRFQVSRMTRSIGNARHSYYADDELAHDMAALLSLLSRRSITVAGCAAYRAFEPGPNKIVRELPQQLLTRQNMRYWPLQPHVIFRQRVEDAEATAIDYNPDPKHFDRDEITWLLHALPYLQGCKNIVLAARFYAEGLELVHKEPDLAYLRITMAMETVARQAIDGTKTEEMIAKNIRPEFKTFMQQFGASETQIREGFVAAVPQYGRPTYQFRAFAEQFHTDELFKRDDLFRTDPVRHHLPTTEKVAAAAAAIYQQRSKFVHEGQPYPATITLGLAPKVDGRALQVDHDEGLALPPLAWAERLAHVCIVNYWRKQADAVKHDRPAPRCVEENRT